MKLKTLVESGDPELLATGFQFTEGPVWHPDGFLLFSDIPADRVHRWTPSGLVDVWRKPSGNSNGLTLDRENRLVACEHGNRRVSRGAAGASVDSLADRYEGKRLNSPQRSRRQVRRDRLLHRPALRHHAQRIVSLQQGTGAALQRPLPHSHQRHSGTTGGRFRSPPMDWPSLPASRFSTSMIRPAGTCAPSTCAPTAP